MAGFLVLAAAACSGGWPGPGLRPAGIPNQSADGYPGMSPAHHELVGGMIFCLTGPGRAVITAVRPIHPIGTIDVVDYAVRPNPFLKGEEGLGGTGTLRTHGFTADRTVDVPCGAVDSGHGSTRTIDDKPCKHVWQQYRLAWQ